MHASFYNGVSGMIAYQESINRISHNIANSNTVGFKPGRSTFSELLYTQMEVNSEEKPLAGHGVKIEDSQLIYRQGPVIQTGNPLDFALLGSGFFAVQRPDGAIEYTRSGAFHISVEGNKGYLVTADGSHVLNSRGKPIELKRESKNSPFDVEGLQEQLGVYDFPNPYSLEPTNGGCFRETEASGGGKAVSAGKKGSSQREYQILQSALEQSAVELSDEMVGVISAQKAFQFNAKMVQTADELEQIINNLR